MVQKKKTLRVTVSSPTFKQAVILILQSVLPGILRDINKDAVSPAPALKRSARFEQLKDGWIKDLQSGLDYGPSSQKEMPHKEAIEYCSKAGGRLPTVKELVAIVDYEKREPAVDKEFFPDAKSGWYWTSNPVAGYSGSAWCVGFGNGYVASSNVGHSNGVRPVRASQ